MAATILLLGQEETQFFFARNALAEQDYTFRFHSIDDLNRLPTDVDLILLDTLSVPDTGFSRFSMLRDPESLRRIPLLALVKDKPARLRYRLVKMGLSDYLTVPFDRLDLQVRVANLLQRWPATAPMVVEEGDDDAPAARPASTSGRSAGVGGGRKGNGTPGLPPLAADTAFSALDSLNRLYARMNRSIFKLQQDSLIDEVLDALQTHCRAELVLYFDLDRAGQLNLTHARPGDLAELDLTVNPEDTPSLVKAIKLGEPTILNLAKPSHPVVELLRSRLNVSVKSLMVFPVVIQNNARAVVGVFKTDTEKFTEFHHQFTQNVIHFIVHSYFLGHLRKSVKGKMDDEVWQFYFEFLDQVINQLSFGIVIIGKDRRVKYLNEHAARLLGVQVEKALYHPLVDFLDDAIVDEILSHVGNGEFSAERPELELSIGTGPAMVVGFSVAAFTDRLNNEEGFIISLKDITYTKELQEEMRRVDRLASLGVMASGIAHEIRNPLAGIKAMAQTFEEELEPDDPKNEYVQRIIRLVNRLDDLLRTLFSYAKPSKPNRRICDIHHVLDDVISLMVQKMNHHQIKLVQDIQSDLPDAFVDPAQIQQVMVNLLLNAIEAINDGGEIQVRVRAFDPRKPPADVPRLPYLAIQTGEQIIEVHIRDSGVGIAEENLNQIFNPFFTTKTFGTGLGLSIVYQIVKENDGIIHYESEVDKGTDCYLYLPAIAANRPE